MVLTFAGTLRSFRASAHHRQSSSFAPTSRSQTPIAPTSKVRPSSRPDRVFARPRPSSRAHIYPPPSRVRSRASRRSRAPFARVDHRPRARRRRRFRRHHRPSRALAHGASHRERGVSTHRIRGHRARDRSRAACGRARDCAASRARANDRDALGLRRARFVARYTGLEVRRIRGATHHDARASGSRASGRSTPRGASRGSRRSVAPRTARVRAPSPPEVQHGRELSTSRL